MSDPRTEIPDTPLTPLARAGYGLAAVWIFGGGAYFFARFSQAVYRAHESSIDRLLAVAARALGMDGFDS
ncbi:MAG: hypothetical protein IIB38_05035 [Candidatus Hydrogenedentes bacterium]|nr:hypothetical protein [Candidatus Hydrogenedentota bacterium]